MERPSDRFSKGPRDFCPPPPRTGRGRGVTHCPRGCSALQKPASIRTSLKTPLSAPVPKDLRRTGDSEAGVKSNVAHVNSRYVADCHTYIHAPPPAGPPVSVSNRHSRRPGMPARWCAGGSAPWPSSSPSASRPAAPGPRSSPTCRRWWRGDPASCGAIPGKRPSVDTTPNNQNKKCIEVL